MAQIEVQEVQGVQKVQIHPIRLIRLIRGRIESTGQGFILVYRLAMDAKTRKGDGGAD